jgi:hypothetical protein
MVPRPTTPIVANLPLGSGVSVAAASVGLLVMSRILPRTARDSPRGGSHHLVGYLLVTFTDVERLLPPASVATARRVCLPIDSPNVTVNVALEALLFGFTFAT